MTHSHLRRFLDVLIIPHPRLLPQSPPPLNNGEHSTNLRQPSKRRQDKRILQPHISNPRRDTIPNSKRHCVPDNNHRNHGITTQIFVAIDTVGDAELDTDCVCGSDDEHGDDETEPVDMVVGADAP